MYVRILTAAVILLLPGLSYSSDGVIQLPAPRIDSPLSAGKVIPSEKNPPGHDQKALTLAQVSQLAWAANGNIPLDPASGAPQTLMTCAAKAYPLEVFLVVGEGAVEKVPSGVYRYDPGKHALTPGLVGDRRQALSQSAKSQQWIASAPVSLIIGAVFEPSQSASGLKSALNFASMEAKNSNKNVLLEARALKLASNTVTELNDSEVCSAVKLPRDMKPLVIVTVGK